MGEEFSSERRWCEKVKLGYMLFSLSLLLSEKRRKAE
jgi:hypothetical protein